MRKLIAKHMVESVQTSPHVTSFVEADVTNMVVWREKVKQLFEKREGTKLTFTPMFMECIAKVLEQFPYINCSLQGDNIILKKDINIGMATALPSGNLIVPVIKGANQLSIVGLSKAVNSLANAARNNQLKPQDTQGGTLTVTNGTTGTGTVPVFLGEEITTTAQVVSGLEFRFTPNPNLTIDVATTLTVYGNDTGGSETIPVTVIYKQRI
jgi:2-oxoglutarate dehydrogenase E2 component (dihydrolipoamide succinyltransferase)